jgi:GNAT superfamily N-acetyltransferase
VTSDAARIVVSVFAPEHQQEAIALVLDGLRERFGQIDENKNVDLADIASYYQDGKFVLAWCGEKLVGTGALKPEHLDIARVCRMSVSKECRRQGIGTMILDYLLDYARSAGFRELVLETTSSWVDAIQFYLQYGFHVVREKDGETHMSMRLGGE